ncbi:restriction endonuclease subunit S [Bacillus marinisedimentorum]|uniref:restriction endonuclease subunit S n=1 Tax=Bacillus marinisedimentorum TaxID=1821260 RepID=UPI0009F4863F|nr:restriction endonuclease subunit S [Bacillus marinisedimentorum]
MVKTEEMANEKTVPGRVPTGWKETSYKEIFKLASGSPLSQKDMGEGDYPVYGGNGIAGYHNAYNFEEPQLVIGRVGAKCGVVHMTPAQSWITDNALYVKEKLADVDDRFMYYKLTYEDLNQHANKNAQPVISGGRIYSIKTILPDVGEQKKIADVLAAWDLAIGLHMQLIGQKIERRKGLMQKLLTGKMRLPGFSGEWRQVRLGDLADIYQPKTISRKDLKESGYPVYGANGLIGYYDQYNHETWQVIITCRGSTCGTVNKTDGKAWVTGNAMVINADGHSHVIDKEFLYYLNLIQDFSKIIGGSGQPQITKKPLEDFVVNIPSDPGEQQELARFFSQADKEIELLERKVSEIETQKDGLLGLLMTGKVRV